MRQIRILSSVNSSDGIMDTYSKLQEQLGNLVETERDAFVPMEPGAIEKLIGLQGNGRTANN